MDLLEDRPVVAVVTIAFAVIIYLILQAFSHPSKKKLAPEAGGAWPIIGHLPLLRPPRLPHKVLGAMADKYGPIFRIRLGVQHVLVISSSEMAKEVLLTNDKAIAGRPKSVAVELMCYNNAMFGFGPYGSYWRSMRKILMHELLSNRRLSMISYVWESEVRRFINKIYKSGPNKVLVDFKEVFGDLTMNIILRIVSSKKFVEFSDEASRFKAATREFMKHLGSFAIGDALPLLRRLDLGGQEKAMKTVFEELDDIVEGWLQEHKSRKCKGQSSVGRDFMDVMLSVIDQETTKDCDYDADSINKSTCLMAIAGGSDTTAVTLTWALSLLMNNPHVLEKAKDELNLKIGKERQVCESDIPKLDYLRAIVKETFRLYPAAPLMGLREFIENCTIGGHNVDKGTRLIVNLSMIFRDPRVWEDPLEFRPERFLGIHKDVDVKGQHFELFPFGAGRRICPGVSFGLQVVHFSLASFLHAFEFSPLNNAPIDMSENFGLTNAKTEPLQVLIAPSLSYESYAD